MEPADSTTSPLRYPLAPNSQTACYSPWLKVRVLIGAALVTVRAKQGPFVTLLPANHAPPTRK